MHSPSLCWGGGGLIVENPPPVFFQIVKKWRRAAAPFSAHLIIHLFRTCCEKFRPRSRKVRSPGHIKWSHPIKSLNVRQRYTDWTIALKLSAIATNNGVYEMYISEFRYRWRQVNFVTSPLKVNGRKMNGASFEQNPFKTLSNIWLEVDLTPWVGTLWPMTPRHVTKVISDHGRSPTVFRE